MIIRSAYNGLSIGFRTFLEGRAGLIATGDRHITRAWDIRPWDGKLKPLEYTISFPGSFFVMELPQDTRYAGTRVRLSEAAGEAKFANQFWVFKRIADDYERDPC